MLQPLGVYQCRPIPIGRSTKRRSATSYLGDTDLGLETQGYRKKCLQHKFVSKSRERLIIWFYLIENPSQRCPAGAAAIEARNFTKTRYRPIRGFRFGLSPNPRFTPWAKCCHHSRGYFPEVVAIALAALTTGVADSWTKSTPQNSHSPNSFNAEVSQMRIVPSRLLVAIRFLTRSSEILCTGAEWP